ncbi:MAG: hypothetical protein V4632_21155 [Pseudomonadota bacterium]
MVTQKGNGDYREDKKQHSWIYFLFGFIAFGASLWSLLWLFSSASLAGGFCNNHFSLLHKHFLCRQPYLAIISCGVLGLISLILFVIGLRQFKRSKLG